MSTIKVKAVKAVPSGSTGFNTLQIDPTLRIKVLDIATGQPLPGAYAIKPFIDASTLNALGKHPLRVLTERDVTLWNSDTKDIALKVKSLRTYISNPPDANPVTKLDQTWQTTPEFIHTLPGRLKKGDSYFQRVDDPDQRYVCVRSKEIQHAERALVSNKEGILEVPLSLSARKCVLELRDYMLLEAQGELAANHPLGEFQVNLKGPPKNNTWKLKRGQTEQEFKATVALEKTLDFVPGLKVHASAPEPDVTLWAVRKVAECTSDAKTKSKNRPSKYKKAVRGVVIHYNSGYYLTEKRGKGKKGGKELCRQVFDDSSLPGLDWATMTPISQKSVLHDNDYFGRPEVSLWILKQIYKSGRTGYHYHIDRSGEILAVVDEEKKCIHAGSSREPDSTSCSVSPKDAGPPALYTHSREKKDIPEDLDDMYIGLNLMGYHDSPIYHFNERQIWYLHRLLENIMSRRSKVMKWHNILGHDEVRKAWKDRKTSRKKKKDKEDPGAALPEGMKRLRGRFYSP